MNSREALAMEVLISQEELTALHLGLMDGRDLIRTILDGGAQRRRWRCRLIDRLVAMLRANLDLNGATLDLEVPLWM